MERLPPANLNLGAMRGRSNEAGSEPFFRQAIELGINFFDTANVYSRGSQ
jgi:aryl-alcohol dehydrogenase-like predicted oxidoreductase